MRAHFALAGWFPEPGDEALYRQAAEMCAPGVRVHWIDGNDHEGVGELWAAADVFLSLVDNIQETFGITPVEAKAAGLPVVASDWDGYRSTIRDGVDGFLVPTLGGPAGALGESAGHPPRVELDSYQTYVGVVAQHTAVDVEGAAERLARLFADPELRRCMGAAGRASARETYDWPTIARRYMRWPTNWRSCGPPLQPRARLRRGRCAATPSAAFSDFATRALTPETVLRLREPDAPFALGASTHVALDDLYARSASLSTRRARSSARWSAPAAQPPRGRWRDAAPAPAAVAMMTLAWLAKLGVLDAWTG